MKEYLKPELQYIRFETEDVASQLPGLGQGTSDNDFTEDDYS